MTDLRFLSAVDAISLMSERRLSARDYVEAHLAAIGAANPHLGAYLEVLGEEAIATARLTDDRRARGEAVPRLAGLPYAVKDLVNVRGRPTTAHSAAPARIAMKNAAVVDRLNEAGAILIGKLALEEWGIGSPLDDLPWPRARNPWDLTRTPGGSSSGSAVALAAGLVPLAIGTDTGGSVRNPAALCGVVGLKPTYGRIVRAGVVPLARTLDHVGPMARTARDCRLLFEALTTTGNNPRSPASAQPLAGLRIAHLSHIYRGEMAASDAVLSALDTACGTFERLGATVVSATLKDFSRYLGAARAVLHAEAYRHHRLRLLTTPNQYGRRCFEELMIGATVSRSAYAEAHVARSALRSDLAGILTDCDLILTAVTADVACRFDDEEDLARSGRGAFRILFNLSGHPALSLGVGFNSEGLPLAMQLVGRMGDDEALLTVAEAFQAATDWHPHWPDPRA